MGIMRVTRYRQSSHAIRALLSGEGQLLDLITTGAPLPQVLRRVCTALDVQLGNVISLISLMDGEEHFTHRLAGIARQCGLYGFSSSAILSKNQELLGTLEMYSCFRRSPSRVESRVIGRATYIAALAIQEHIAHRDSGTNSFPWNARMQWDAQAGPMSRN
jgi:hypothetical protein